METESDTKDLLADAFQRSASYWHSIPERRVSPSQEAVQALARLRESLPELPCPDREILALLDEIGSPATVATTGGRYFG